MNFKKLLLFTVCSFAWRILPTSAGEFPDNWTWDSSPQQRAAHAILEGKPMPALDATNWINGEVKLTGLKGKVVVVDFYATWCGPCMAAIPENNALFKKYSSQGLILFGVCTSKHGQDVFAANARKHGITYPVACDANLISQKAWAVHYLPTYAVIDRKGILRTIGLHPEFVETVVQKLLAEPLP